jgi:hypothetical protein
VFLIARIVPTCQGPADDQLSAKSGEQVRDPLKASSPLQAAVGRLDGTDITAALDDDSLRLYGLRTGELTIPPVEMSSTRTGSRGAESATETQWSRHTSRP